MAGILGIGTGIDIDSIVTALVNAEKAPKTQQLDRLEKATTSRFSALGTLKGSLSGLQTAIQNLNKPSLFSTRTASSSSSAVLSAKADSAAIAGKYSVQVQQLATSSKVGLQSVPADASTTFSSGKMTISAGSTSIEVDVSATNNTLAGMRDSINAAGKDKGISATIVTDASGSRLVLSSTATGAGNDIKIAVTEDGVTSGTVSLASQAFQPSASLKLPAFSGAPASTLFQSGNLAIRAGNSTLNVAISDGSSLESVRDAINAAGTGQGVSASIETDVAGSRLVLNSTNGTSLELTATAAGGTPTSNPLTSLNPASDVSATSSGPDSTSGAAGVITKAQSAVLFVDGLKVVSASNTVTSAIDGVTLNLAGAQSASDLAAGKTVDVTIGVDKGSVKSNIQKFVDSYNSLMNTAAQQTAVVQVGEGSNPVTGALVGDATVRGLLSGLRNELVKMTGEEGTRALADLGITTQKDGTLKIDDAKLSSALDTKFDQVANYFTGDKGLMVRLDKNVGEYLKAGGVFDQRTKALQSTLTGPGGIDEQRKALDLRVSKIQERLVAQYTAMDQLVSRLQKTSESLSNQLASLPGLVKKD
ncbi:flagellar filament capping protein FliD [Pseudomonas alcaligenes]|jgi:flagellar hook-associated protein 2|uniref:flagellar filament capping protein FliD n=1 Tax=Aquipseudomonas alcaligenes TaxID=43263 RepID=UPI002E7C31B0|nr:flagellar filament capping protein FliD [Pseudomonas alcaligenes]MEE1949781.1 flagellar filament capping protein FliD [Pseudomonas alcaligenes]